MGFERDDALVDIVLARFARRWEWGTGRGEARRRRAKKNPIFRIMREQASVYTMMLTMME